MIITKETVEVYTPEPGKCIKVMNKGEVVTYMAQPYYKLPHYKYTIEEVPVEEAQKWVKATGNKVRKLFGGRRK